jgi:divalent metal cation (Fe/Co/Zn/Cd) transporter
MKDGESRAAARTRRPEAEADRLRRRGLWLEVLTMIWTLTVAIAAIAAGVTASSIALIGLGLESAIELLAATIVIWLLSANRKHEPRALVLIAGTFLAGAVYLAAESTRELASHVHSRHSAAGLAVAAAALVLMSLLAVGKRRTGRALGNRVLLADGAETALSAAAAAAALAGVGLDTWLGWWWTVPAAGLAIAGVAVIEAVEIWAHR